MSERALRKRGRRRISPRAPSCFARSDSCARINLRREPSDFATTCSNGPDTAAAAVTIEWPGILACAPMRGNAWRVARSGALRPRTLFLARHWRQLLRRATSTTTRNLPLTISARSWSWPARLRSSRRSHARWALSNRVGWKAVVRRSRNQRPCCAESRRWYASRSAEFQIRYGEPIRRRTAAYARGAATEAAWMPVLSRIRANHGGLSYASNCAGRWPRSLKAK